MEFRLRNQGREFGSYSVEQIEAMLDDHQIGMMAEVFDGSQWITVDEFFERYEGQKLQESEEARRQQEEIVRREEGDHHKLEIELELERERTRQMEMAPEASYKQLTFKRADADRKPGVSSTPSRPQGGGVASLLRWVIGLALFAFLVIGVLALVWFAPSLGGGPPVITYQKPSGPGVSEVINGIYFILDEKKQGLYRITDKEGYRVTKSKSWLELVEHGKTSPTRNELIGVELTGKDSAGANYLSYGIYLYWINTESEEFRGGDNEDFNYKKLKPIFDKAYKSKEQKDYDALNKQFDSIKKEKAFTVYEKELDDLQKNHEEQKTEELVAKNREDEPVLAQEVPPYPTKWRSFAALGSSDHKYMEIGRPIRIFKNQGGKLKLVAGFGGVDGNVSIPIENKKFKKIARIGNGKVEHGKEGADFIKGKAYFACGIWGPIDEGDKISPIDGFLGYYKIRIEPMRQDSNLNMIDWNPTTHKLIDYKTGKEITLLHEPKNQAQRKRGLNPKYVDLIADGKLPWEYLEEKIAKAKEEEINKQEEINKKNRELYLMRFKGWTLQAIQSHFGQRPYAGNKQQFDIPYIGQGYYSPSQEKKLDLVFNFKLNNGKVYIVEGFYFTGPGQNNP